MTDRSPSTSGSQPAHPDDELLVGYMVAGLDPERERAVEQHLEVCDTCVESLASAQHRISMAAEVAVPVPRLVRERAESRLADSAVAATPVAAARPWLSVLWRLPVLVPVAVTVGLVIGLSAHMLLVPETPHSHTRAIPMVQILRVTAPEAAVRKTPNAGADVLATLPRGTQVEIHASERDWYRVRAPNGPEGWVESRAFD